MVAKLAQEFGKTKNKRYDDDRVFVIHASPGGLFGL